MMRALLLLICSIFPISTWAGAAPITPLEPTDGPSGKTSDAQRNVRVEVLMVAMPQDKLLPLLPDLEVFILQAWATPIK